MKNEKKDEKKNEIVIKTSADVKVLARILEDLVSSFKAGTVCVEKGKEFVTLTPGDSFQVEIEAARKKNKQKISIDLSWTLNEPKEETVPEFRISCTEPEIKSPEAAEQKEEEIA